MWGMRNDEKTVGQTHCQTKELLNQSAWGQRSGKRRWWSHSGMFEIHPSSLLQMSILCALL